MFSELSTTITTDVSVMRWIRACGVCECVCVCVRVCVSMCVCVYSLVLRLSTILMEGVANRGLFLRQGSEGKYQ